MTKDDRAAFYELMWSFTPSLVLKVEKDKLVDEQVLTLVGEAFSYQEAKITDLLEQLAQLHEQLDQAKDELEQALLGSQGTAASPEEAPEPAPVPVPPEQVQALLRRHKILYQDAHLEVYMDEQGVQRTRKKTVPRPAQAEDVIGMRDTEEALYVVLGDGRHHTLPWALEEVS